MGEREAFYTAMEADPGDFLTPQVFADWLDEHGEYDLAEGYRAMGRLRRRPSRCKEADSPTGIRWQWYCGLGRDFREQEDLPGAWSDSLGNKHKAYVMREALDAAALAYSRIASEQKAEAEQILTTHGG